MTVFTGQISQSTDDGEQLHSSNAMTLTNSSDVLKQATAEAQWWAGRFQNVTVPPTATISASSLSVWPTTGTNAMNGKIFGNLTPNPGTLQTTSSYISNLAETSGSVTWNATLTNGQFNASPDLTSSVIGPVISQAGQASGDAVLLMIEAQSTINGCQIEEYDGSTSECAELSITYISGSPPGAPTNVTPSYGTSTSVQLGFTQGSGTVTDNLVRYSTDNATWTTLDLLAVSTSCDIVALTTGQLYYFQAAASNSAGTSWSSPSAEFVCGANPPSAGTAIGCTNGLSGLVGARVFMVGAAGAVGSF